MQNFSALEEGTWQRNSSIPLVVYAVEVARTGSSLGTLRGQGQYGGDALDPFVFHWRDGAKEIWLGDISQEKLSMYAMDGSIWRKARWIETTRRTRRHTKSS
jgi:hypothetical protein